MSGDGRIGLTGQGAFRKDQALDAAPHSRPMRRRAALALLTGSMLAGGAGPARAETLYQAFSDADATNPVLSTQRAAVRIGAGDRAIAATGYAPALSATSDYGYHDQKGIAPGNPRTEQTSHPRGYGATLTQNLWNGFKTTNSVAREDAALDAARDDLRDVEQQVLLDVATAYADVRRDRSILALRRSDREVLDASAKQTRYLFGIGALTRTDVDQSEAGLARSLADLTLAGATLDAGMAIYRARVGHDPGKLEPAAVPPALLPRDLPSALVLAQADHPAIRAALDTVRAAEINVDVEKAGFAPSLDLTASADRRWDPNLFPVHTILNDVSVVGRLTVPIYDQGLTLASVHHAGEVVSQRMAQLDQRRAEIRARVVEAWGLFDASRIVIAAARAQIAASDRALFGVRLEAGAGQRTTFDILTAQRSLLDARVNLEIAEHDRIIAGYKLLASLGRLSLEAITPAATRAKPEAQPRDAPFKPLPVDAADFDSIPLRQGR